MSCPGLHCPGCSGGQSLGILAAAAVVLYVAAEAVAWVAEHIWWIAGTLAVAFVLAVAGCMALQAWTDRREAKFAARRGLVSRADVMGQTGGAYEAVAEVMPQRNAPAIAPPQLVINVFGTPTAEQAAIIRQALPGRAGGAITEGKPQP
jgi:hypothetical protein